MAWLGLSVIPLLHKHSQYFLSQLGAQHLFVLLLTFTTGFLSLFITPSVFGSSFLSVRTLWSWNKSSTGTASEDAHSNCHCLRGQIYKTQIDIDKQCPMSSEIGFPSNLPSVLCFRVLRLSAVSNTIQLTKVHNIIENNAARELQSENDSNSQSTMNA